MSRTFYRLAYAVGFKPWEQDADSLAPQLRPLLDREEQQQGRPLGFALDLGCGTGRWSVELAQRGWNVTGIDVVPKAVSDARERARAADVDVRFIEGNVTDLGDAGVGTGFRFFLDIECFNHLNDEQRRAVGREVTSVADADARILLLVWRRALRGPLPSGASRKDVEDVFEGWRLLDEEPYAGPLPTSLRSIKPTWYRLGRS